MNTTISSPSSPLSPPSSVNILTCSNGFLINDKNYTCKPAFSPSSLNCPNGYTLLSNNRAVCNPNINSPQVLNCPNGVISIMDPISKNRNYYACKPLLSPSSYYCPDGGYRLDNNRYTCKLPLSQNKLTCLRGIKFVNSNTISCR